MRKYGSRFNESLANREKKMFKALEPQDRKLIELAVEDAASKAVDDYQGEDEKFSIKADIKKGVIKTLINNHELESSKEAPASKYAESLFKDFQWMTQNKATVDRILETAKELRSTASSGQ